jgi:hypothetical protein
MDYNNTNNNTNLNYYPTFDSPLSNIHFHFIPSYNDNSFNPPSTSTDITRHQLSRDSLTDNIENVILNKTNLNQIPHKYSYTQHTGCIFFQVTQYSFTNDLVRNRYYVFN